MPACAAFGCTNRTSSKSKRQLSLENSDKKITFHRFPHDVERKKLWIKAIRRENWEPTKNSQICSVHFAEQAFDRTSVSVVRLRENAVPSIFDVFPSYLKIKRTLKRRSPSKRCTESTVITGSSNECEDAIAINEVSKTASNGTLISSKSKRKRFVSPTKEILIKSFKFREAKYIRIIKKLRKSELTYKKTICDFKKLLHFKSKKMNIRR